MWASLSARRADTEALDAATQSELDSARAEIEQSANEDEAFYILGRYAKELANTDGLAFFRYSPSDNSLKCVQSSEGSYRFLRGHVFYSGERITGWAWANRRTICNGNAALELSDVPGFAEPLKSALSTTVAAESGTEPVGVLTAYADQPDAFEPRHVYAFERLSEFLGSYISKIACTA